MSAVNPKILLVSSVRPLDRSAGEVILYRHFAKWPDVELTVAALDGETSDLGRIVDVTDRGSVSRVLNRGLKRVSRTRLVKFSNAARMYVGAEHSDRKLREAAEAVRPDLILTVAHGELWWPALKLAKTSGIPLATIYHDWWPDYEDRHGVVHRSLDARFRRLYAGSDLVFCVSEDMRAELGPHPNARLLYPMTADRVATDPPPAAGTPVVVYAGNLSGTYGRMILRLAEAMTGTARFKLRLFGPTPDWPAETVQKMTDAGIYEGLKKSGELTDALNAADVLLVATSFEAREERLMRTNFPSKLVEYCRFGRPILMWGPEYGSGIRWARQRDAAVVVEQPEPSAVVTALNDLLEDAGRRQGIGAAALAGFQALFDPAELQQKFIDGIRAVIGDSTWAGRAAGRMAK